jgi:hypothetical protein
MQKTTVEGLLTGGCVDEMLKGKEIVNNIDFAGTQPG